MTININELRPAVEAAGLNAISMQEVLELLDRLDAAESDALEQARLNGRGASREAEKERDTLRARIEEMEKQGPVAWMSSRNGFICKDNKNTDYNMPLYLAPGAQPAPSVPEGWPTDEMTTAFAAVFNVRDQQATFAPAFRAALAAAPEAKP